MIKFSDILKEFRPRRLSYRITWSMLILFSIFSLLIIIDWVYNIEPRFKSSEQAKADILMLSSSVPIQQALVSNDIDKIKALADQLLSLEDPVTGTPLITGIEVETLEGKKIVDEKPGSDFEGFVSESILFSHDMERNMLGNSRLYYSGHFFSKLKKDGKKQLAMALGFLVGILVVIRLLLGYFLRPLSQLSLYLREFDPKKAKVLEELRGPKSFEINQVKSAMDELLSELKEYQENLENRVNERTMELSKLNETLKNEIEERKQTEKDLQQARKKAETANRAKSEFLANMSHEIRTPMNSVVGLTALALNLELTPKLRSYLNTIQTSAQSLLGIIDDILDFSKIEAGGLKMENAAFWLHDSMEKISDMFCEEASKKGIELIIQIHNDVPCALIGDPLRLEQVLINLTNNAVKFTEKGEVFINVTCLEKTVHKAKLLFTIKDTGIGINKEAIEKLFDAFTQVDGSTTRQYGGTGLGLTISKRLVELMGGEIWVDSELGTGSTFQFTVHLNRQAEENERKTITPIEVRSLHVHVVDDNATSRRILKTILESFGFRVSLSSSGEEAIDKLKGNLSNNDPVQLVIMDWKMEGMDGITAAQIIKKDERLKGVPIIMMTAFGREQEQKRAEEIGIEAFLIKPVKQSLLFNTIMEVFGHSKIKFFGREQKILTKESIQYNRLKGAYVLLVEDNPINQEVANEILNSAGIIVDTAGSGIEALEALKNHDYDCVLMDVQMPEMDGYEVTRIIRDMDRLKALPIIAMTAHAMVGDREKCLEAGMNDYVSKPINPGTLFSVMSKWIKSIRHPDVDPIRNAQNSKTTEQSILPEHLPGIDMEEGLSRLSGNKTLFIKLLRDMVRDYRDIDKKIKDAIDRKESHSAHKEVHALKGISGNLSATRLYRAIIDVEKAMKANELDNILLLLENLKTAMDEVTESVGKMDKTDEKTGTTKKISDDQKIDINIEEVSPLINDLAESIKNRNPVDSEKCLASLKSILEQTALHERMGLLESFILRYDFKKAFELLVNISNEFGILLEGE